jgi:hypothetical protein
VNFWENFGSFPGFGTALTSASFKDIEKMEEGTENSDEINE